MNIRITAPKGLMALALAFGLGVAGTQMIQPVLAGNTNTAPIIDADFENALRKHFQKRFFNLIDATGEQQTQISKLLQERQEQTRPQREQLRQGLLELSQLMANDATTDDQIKDKVAKLKEMRAHIQDERLDTILKVRAILTPEQRKAVSDRISGIITGNIRPRRVVGLIDG